MSPHSFVPEDVYYVHSFVHVVCAVTVRVVVRVSVTVSARVLAVATFGTQLLAVCYASHSDRPHQN